MRYFLDTEFNGFDGALISIALVPELDGDPPFYEAVDCPNPTEWVSLNVLPVLQTDPISRDELSHRLFDFLSGHEEVAIIADWPEDIAHCASLLAYQGNQRFSSKRISFELLSLDGFISSRLSEVPHNAFHDAVALRHFCLDQFKRS